MATTTFNNAAVDGNANNVANWDNGLPNPGDDVIIAGQVLSGTISQANSIDVTSNGDIEGGTYSTAGATMTFSGGSMATLGDSNSPTFYCTISPFGGSNNVVMNCTTGTAQYLGGWVVPSTTFNGGDWTDPATWTNGLPDRLNNPAALVDADPGDIPYALTCGTAVFAGGMSNPDGNVNCTGLVVFQGGTYTLASVDAPLIQFQSGPVIDFSSLTVTGSVTVDASGLNFTCSSTTVSGGWIFSAGAQLTLGSGTPMGGVITGSSIALVGCVGIIDGDWTGSTPIDEGGNAFGGGTWPALVVASGSTVTAGTYTSTVKFTIGSYLNDASNGCTFNGLVTFDAGSYPTNTLSTFNGGVYSYAPIAGPITSEAITVDGTHNGVTSISNSAVPYLTLKNGGTSAGGNNITESLNLENTFYVGGGSSADTLPSSWNIAGYVLLSYIGGDEWTAPSAIVVADGGTLVISNILSGNILGISSSNISLGTGSHAYYFGPNTPPPGVSPIGATQRISAA